MFFGSAAVDCHVAVFRLSPSIHSCPIFSELYPFQMPLVPLRLLLFTVVALVSCQSGPMTNAPVRCLLSIPCCVHLKLLITCHHFTAVQPIQSGCAPARCISWTSFCHMWDCVMRARSLPYYVFEDLTRRDTLASLSLPNDAISG